MEEYDIISVNGFQVVGKKFYSRVFGSVEEAEAERKSLQKTDKREQTEVRTYKKK